MRDILRLGVVLMLYTAGAGAALAYGNILTHDRIQENMRAAETRARNRVLECADRFEGRQVGGGFEYWAGFAGPDAENPCGWVFIAAGAGYSSTIRTMVGVDTAGRITGTEILFQQETPGLGAKIAGGSSGASPFMRQFTGLAQSDLQLSKEGGAVDGLTGATISSRAVTVSIRQGMEQLEHAIGGAE